MGGPKYSVDNFCEFFIRFILERKLCLIMSELVMKDYCCWVDSTTWIQPSKIPNDVMWCFLLHHLPDTHIPSPFWVCIPPAGVTDLHFWLTFKYLKAMLSRSFCLLSALTIWMDNGIFSVFFTMAVVKVPAPRLDTVTKKWS